MQTPNSSDLGDFLRKRRHRLDFAQSGLARTASRRRTPGLRREEVAELAGISPAWYTKLEAKKVQPSTATLLSIALVLHLSDAETDYLFELAGLAAPLRRRDSSVDIPQALREVVRTSEGAASLYDCYMTPLLWNDAGGALFGYDARAGALDRNMIVRGLADERLIRFFGEDYDLVAQRTIGTFRRTLATHRPTELAQQIYDFASKFEIFRRYWNEETIVNSITLPGIIIRHHDAVGTVRANVVDLRVGPGSDAFLRILTPADGETAAKFEQLRYIGAAAPHL